MELTFEHFREKITQGCSDEFDAYADFFSDTQFKQFLRELGFTTK